MERFAIVGGQDQGRRYIEAHPLLRLLPVRWAESMIPKEKARFTEILYNKYSRDELGYILDVPGFFVEQDRLTESDRIKIIHNLVDVLIGREINILVFPLWRKFISVEEKSILDENSIILLDGGLIKLVSLMDTVDRLFAILKAKPNEMEVGIWGADNIVGKIWTEFLAPRLNNLVIGGRDVKTLEEISNDILYDTGLSCQITMDPHQCLDKKFMVILSSVPDDWDEPDYSKITIWSYGLGKGNLVIQKKDSKVIFIESGFPVIPQNLQTSNALSPHDEVGVVEATLFIMDETYRNFLMNCPLNMENINMVKEILIKYEIGSAGMISNNEILSYNGFRRLYFGNLLDKVKDGIL